MGKKRKNRKRRKPTVSSKRARRHSKLEQGKNILGIIYFLIMIAFSITLLFTLYQYREQIDNILYQYNNSTIPSIIFTLIRLLMSIFGGF
ncbi:MAG: hypothetical protein ACTSRH_08625 [Promethearchaeota archaeon]